MEGHGQIPRGAPNPDAAEAGPDQETRRAQEEQMKRDLMTTLMDSSARERLSRIALVRPDRSNQIEEILLKMAQTGQLRGRVTEAQLIELLEQMEEAQGKTTTKKSTIVYQRRKDLDDDFDIE